MPFTVYRSTDNGAPAFNGTQGSILNVLKKCLVEGYGDKSPAGWTVEFEDTAAYKLVLRNGASSIARSYFRIVDGTSRGNMRGYHQMTDIDTGTGEFPTTSQLSAGCVFQRPQTAQPWTMFADERTCLLLIYSGIPSSGWFSNYLGDCIPLNPSNQMASLVSHASSSSGACYLFQTLGFIGTSLFPGAAYLKGTGGSPNSTAVAPTPAIVGRAAYYAAAVSSPIYTLSHTSPMVGGKLLLNPFFMYSSSGEILVRMRFAYCINNTGLSEGDTFGGTGILSGKRFEVFRVHGGDNNNTLSGNYVAFETLNPD